jgi:hypothetical protein
MSKFTPGPWRVSDLDRRAVVAADELVVADIVNWRNTDDARLIAAAPELLEAHEAFTGPATREDERCKAMLYRQARVAALLHSTGKSLLSGKSYKPVLTKPQPPERPARADAVVLPIRRKK